MVLGQGAFVGTNAAFGPLEAQLAGSPMLVLVDTTEGGDFSSNPRDASGWGHYGAFDLRRLFEGITKFSVLASTPKEAVFGFQMAMIATGDLGGDSPAELSETDFAAIAEGFGAEGFRVERPAEIPEAVREALRTGKPTVIDVITEKHESLKSITAV